MRIVSILSAFAVVFTLYMLVLEREQLADLAAGDFGALGRTAAADIVRGAFGAELTAPEVAPDAAEEPQEAATPQRREVSVVSQLSQARSIDRAVVLRGRTEAARQVEVRAETAGRVISEPLRRGAAVGAGEVLCEIAAGTRPSALAEARARLAEAELNARAAERLSEGGFASELRAAGASAGRESAAAAVAAAEEELERLVIRAPFEGLLETDTAELGSLLQPGALCATIIQLDPIRLVGFVPETKVDQIARGAPAGGRLSSGREVFGEVSFIARAADPATRTFRVEIRVDNADGRIRDGQTAEIGIAATGTEAHLVPGSALTLDDDGRLGLRLVTEEGRASFTAVQVVRDTSRGVWVTGLPEEAEIIVVGQEFVAEGTPVRATRRDAPEPPDTASGLLRAVDAAAADRDDPDAMPAARAVTVPAAEAPDAADPAAAEPAE